MRGKVKAGFKEELGGRLKERYGRSAGGQGDFRKGMEMGNKWRVKEERRHDVGGKIRK